jgi:hypothetical protein
MNWTLKDKFIPDLTGEAPGTNMYLKSNIFFLAILNEQNQSIKCRNKLIK